LELTPGAGAAGEVVAAVPGPADAVAYDPFLLGGWNGDDCADEFVAEAAYLAVEGGMGLAGRWCEREMDDNSTYGGPKSPFTTLWSE
jgi:hypothetical protein